MVRFLLTMNLEFTDQGNLKVYMNLAKAITYFVQLAEMMAPGPRDEGWNLETARVVALTLELRCGL